MKKKKTFKANEQEFYVGQVVSARVPWPDGRQTTMEGTLIAVVDDEAFIETSAGPVAGDANTLEAV